eukprot:2024719-Ditylum_brightwellii.AAC.1
MQENNAGKKVYNAAMLPPNTTKESSFDDNRTKNPISTPGDPTSSNTNPRGFTDHTTTDKIMVLFSTNAPISYYTIIYCSTITRDTVIIYPYHGILPKNTIIKGKQQQQQQQM